MFTGLFTGTRRLFRLLGELQTEVLSLQRAVNLLEDRLSTLEGQHKTLRGRFYATRPDATASVDSLGDTREARRKAALAKYRNGNGSIMPPGHQE